MNKILSEVEITWNSKEEKRGDPQISDSFFKNLRVRTSNNDVDTEKTLQG